MDFSFYVFCLVDEHISANDYGLNHPLSIYSLLTDLSSDCQHHGTLIVHSNLYALILKKKILFILSLQKSLSYN